MGSSVDVSKLISGRMNSNNWIEWLYTAANEKDNRFSPFVLVNRGIYSNAKRKVIQKTIDCLVSFSIVHHRPLSMSNHLDYSDCSTLALLFGYLTNLMCFQAWNQCFLTEHIEHWMVSATGLQVIVHFPREEHFVEILRWMSIVATNNKMLMVMKIDWFPSVPVLPHQNWRPNKHPLSFLSKCTNILSTYWDNLVPNQCRILKTNPMSMVDLTLCLFKGLTIGFFIIW